MFTFFKSMFNMSFKYNLFSCLILQNIIYIKRCRDVKWVNPSIRPIVHPAGRTVHPSRHLFIYNNPKSVSSSSRTVFFLGGFVFVATSVVAQTQHRDKDFLSGFVFVTVAAVAQTQHTEQPLIHLVIQPDCFFFGWVCFCAVWRTKCGGKFLTVDIVFLGERHAG
jgi:hypothetical protein